MSYFRTPGYYSRFACKASACTDSCCIGWEIDIDDDTWEYYRRVPGDFGRLIAERIEPPCGEETAHIRLCEDERCPFLDEHNLCEIYRNLGEEALSQICTDHPRFYEWYEDGTEAGLGLCCEAAAEFVLAEETGRNLVTEEEIEEDAELPGEDAELSDTEDAALQDDDTEQWDDEGEEISDGDGELRAIEDWLFAARDRLMDAVYADSCEPTGAATGGAGTDSCESTGAANGGAGADPGEGTDTDPCREIDALFDRIFDLGEAIDHAYSEAWVPETDASEEENTDSRAVLCGKKNEFHYSEWFWNEECQKSLLKLYLNLEINSPVWSDILHELFSNLKETLAVRSEFLVSYRRQIREYRRLLDYYLYRYFMKARFDDLPGEKVHLALYSVGMLILLGANEFRKSGELSHERQIELCKLYSKEIEYNEENVEALSAYPNLTGGDE